MAVPRAVSRLTRAERWCLAFGLVVAGGLFLYQAPEPLRYDAADYARAAMDIRENGLLSKFHSASYHTYAYPLFVSGVQRAIGGLGLELRLGLFVAQLALFVVGIWLVRRALLEVQPAAARLVFCGLLVNPYSLLYTSECLTESLSLTLILVVASSWLRLWRFPDRLAPLIAGSLAAGLAAMVRPAAVFLLGPWLLGCGLLWLRRRSRPATVLVGSLVALASAAVPFVPQVLGNSRNFGRPTPLIVQDLGTSQVLWGVQMVKYATGVPPVPKADLRYSNPFAAGTTIDAQRPLGWYREHPMRGALTVALHTFNLIDQDLLFTYSRDVRPWYRVPLGMVNHAVVALGVLGLSLWGLTVARPSGRGSIDAFLVVVALLAAQWAIHALTAVEMRFGLVPLMVLFPLAFEAARRVREVGVVWPTAIYVVLYVTAALLLSSWVRTHLPLLRTAA